MSKRQVVWKWTQDNKPIVTVWTLFVLAALFLTIPINSQAYFELQLRPRPIFAVFLSLLVVMASTTFDGFIALLIGFFAGFIVQIVWRARYGKMLVVILFVLPNLLCGGCYMWLEAGFT